MAILDPLRPYVDLIRLALWIALALAIAGVGFYGGLRWNADEVADAEAATNECHYQAAKEQAKAVAFARADERAKAKTQAGIAAKLIQENADALADRDRTIADLRAGRRQLRDRFTCRVPDAPAGTRGSDEAAAGGLLIEDAEFLVSLAADADEVARQLQACQAVIQSDRAPP